jgi:hypothetical protein
MKQLNLFRRPISHIVLESCRFAPLRRSALRCIVTILRYFFFLQYYAVLFPKRIPVSWADHPLDEKIPFNPRYIRTYLTFVIFWIHLVGFLLGRYGGSGRGLAVEFVKSMERLYLFAAQVYKKNLSTTKRSKYNRNYFRLVHATDPHLMCIPSLHIMIVIHTYTMLREFLARRGEGEVYSKEAEDLRCGALAITEAVLYVKQHSINCISAAMYAMTCFSPSRFFPEEAERFAGDIFSGKAFDQANPEIPKNPGPEVLSRDREPIIRHILDLYYAFLAEGEKSSCWERPLLDFLAKLPSV